MKRRGRIARIRRLRGDIPGADIVRLGLQMPVAGVFRERKVFVKSARVTAHRLSLQERGSISTGTKQRGRCRQTRTPSPLALAPHRFGVDMRCDARLKTPSPHRGALPSTRLKGAQRRRGRWFRTILARTRCEAARSRSLDYLWAEQSSDLNSSTWRATLRNGDFCRLSGA